MGSAARQGKECLMYALDEGYLAGIISLKKACRHPHSSSAWTQSFTGAGDGFSNPIMSKIRKGQDIGLDANILFLARRSLCRASTQLSPSLHGTIRKLW